MRPLAARRREAQMRTHKPLSWAQCARPRTTETVRYLGILLILTNSCIVDSRTAAHQASAVGALRTINTAALTYASTYGHGFPASLDVLGPPKLGESTANPQPTEASAGLVDERLAASNKAGYAGYRFDYVPGAADSNGKIPSYTVNAEPTVAGVSGTMYYFTNQTGVIRQAKGKPADEHSELLQ